MFGGWGWEQEELLLFLVTPFPPRRRQECLGDRSVFGGDGGQEELLLFLVTPAAEKRGPDHLGGGGRSGKFPRWVWAGHRRPCSGFAEGEGCSSGSPPPPPQKGDTPLHIAIRGRSRKLAEMLLRNPKDGRLLYRPNKAGETPYNIDCSHQKSILTQIFGASECREVPAADTGRWFESLCSHPGRVL